MALKKITPVHEAIDAIDETIRALKLQRAALIATLPAPKRNSKAKQQKGSSYLVHPITGKKAYF
jgi:hypothetical protein